LKTTVRYAVVSFCSDLTDPRAESKPIAVVGLDAAREPGFWFYVSSARPGAAADATNDSIARSVLDRLPALFDEQIRVAMKEVGPERFISWLHDRFRNSLHVSAVEDQQVQFSSQGSLLDAVLKLHERVTSGGAKHRSAPKGRPAPVVPLRAVHVEPLRASA
jgi:hypothetical protein